MFGDFEGICFVFNFKFKVGVVVIGDVIVVVFVVAVETEVEPFGVCTVGCGGDVVCERAGASGGDCG